MVTMVQECGQQSKGHCQSEQSSCLAFLTNDDLDQILWHMTVLEALLGERNEVTKSIRRRICNIPGSTKEERGKIHMLSRFLHKLFSSFHLVV
jgi:hypothetical protein